MTKAPEPSGISELAAKINALGYPVRIKRRRSKFVVFTYVWQVVMAAIVVGCLALAVWAFLSSDWHGVLFVIYAVTFGFNFVTGGLWRKAW